jgi:hypothetical protein
MAAGLGFKTFTTGEVLTAADTNGYLMQGILVFASAAARDAAITSPQEGQFAYLKDTNVTTYYTGSAWANVDTTGMTNPMTTTGDTIYSSSGSTPARLGIGSTGQVLTVAAGLPSWATPAGGGGMTLINTGGTTLTGSSVAISSIPGTYKNLQLIIRNFKPSTDGAGFQIRYNSDSSASYADTGTNATGETPSQTSINVGVAADSGTAQGLTVNDIYDYANTETWKTSRAMSFANNQTTTTNYNTYSAQGIFAKTTAISTVNILASSGNFTSGTAYLYGVS